MDLQALRLSLELAALTTTILVLLGVPLSYWLTQSRRACASVLETSLMLPMVLPPTVLGFYLLLVFAPLKLAFTFSGLALASVITGTPYAMQSFLTAFRSVERGYLERAWTLGESGPRTLVRVAIPLAKDGLVTGALLAFAHTVGEFGVVLMIGGNIPGVSRTLAIALYDQVEAFDYAAANRTALLLLIFSFAVMGMVAWIRTRAPRAWR